MNISHRQLEECRRRPREWVARQFDPNYVPPRGGYNVCLREGIFQFHKNGDRQAARDYIEERIRNQANLKDPQKAEKALQKFDEYVDWCLAERVSVISHRFNVKFDLGNDIFLSGQISRIDMIPSGYRVILLQPIPENWTEELRMPLLQRAVARFFGNRPENEFSIGFQELDGSSMGVRVFDHADIDAAEQAARSLAGLISSECGKYHSGQV